MAKCFSICVEHREINKSCCDNEKITYYSSHGWCAPRKTNDVAWKRIANGEILWDRRKKDRGKFTNRQQKNYPSSSNPLWRFFVIKDELGKYGYVHRKITNVGKK